MHTKDRGLVPPKKVLSGHKKPFKMTVEMLAIFLALIDLSSLVAQSVKSLPAMQETWVRSLGWEDPLEKEMATHSSIAWRIPWTSLVGNSPWGHKELDTTKFLFFLKNSWNNPPTH